MTNQQRSGNGGSQLVSFSNCLKLSPPELEKAFWKSPSAVRVLKAFDLIGLCYNIFTYFMLIRTFGIGRGSGMSWQHQLPVVTYFTLGMLQLLALLLAPALHQRYRFRVTVFNRILRLMTLTFAAYTSSPSVMGKMTSRVNSSQRTHTSQIMSLIRPVVGPPLVYLNHCNHVLPFYLVLPMQLYTFAALGMMFRSTACVLAGSPDHLAMASYVCRMAKMVMYYASMLLGRPASESSTRPPPVCFGVESTLLLLTYVHVVLLVVLPCFVVGYVELSLKVNFVRLKGWRLQQQSPLVDSGMVRAVVIYTAVVGSWFACEALITSLSPLTCSADGHLQFANWPSVAAAANANASAGSSGGEL